MKLNLWYTYLETCVPCFGKCSFGKRVATPLNSLEFTHSRKADVTNTQSADSNIVTYHHMNDQ